MVLTAQQHLLIATVYEKAAADKLGLPRQQRAAFVQGRMGFASLLEQGPRKTRPQPQTPKQSCQKGLYSKTAAPVKVGRRRAKYQTVEERLKKARAAV